MEASVVGPIGRGRKAPKGLAFGARIVPPLMHPLPSPLPRFTPPASKEAAISTRGEEASSIDPLSLIPTSLKEDNKDQASPSLSLSPPPPPPYREIKSQPMKASRPSIKKKFDYWLEV